MCGICASVLLKLEGVPFQEQYDLAEDLKNGLRRRGPDFYGAVSSEFKPNLLLAFYASVLHLRGPSLVKQPLSDQGNVLLYNGEIFNDSMVESAVQSDTSVLFGKLSNAKNPCEIHHVISGIKGPFAFIFYQQDKGCFWFGRDVFGRRSLLINCERDQITVCSTGAKGGNIKWQEVSASGVFCLDLNLTHSQNHFVIHHFSWSCSPSGVRAREPLHLENAKVLLSDSEVPNPVDEKLNRTVPLPGFQPPCRIVPPHGHELKHEDLFHKILAIDVFRDAVERFENVLSEAVKKRVECVTGLCKRCYSQKSQGVENVMCQHASVGVLFSGGLDSIVLASLADRHLSRNKPLDLLNVAFDSHSLRDNQSSFHAPDRITGENGVKSLKEINPSRLWNFVKVNISKEELVSERQKSILHLLQPSCTVLDDSIGCALWFAARGQGFISSGSCERSYTSQVRVLLVGMGADEQLAGYSRHRAKFNSSGWDSLINELSLELDRIGSRNLGRDDRIIADHGVESRYPFLDENVVSFLNSLDVWIKADLGLPRGLGEKLLLRLLAFKLGLRAAAFLPKRAIQFGSRIAKIEDSKEKGSDLCTRLTS